MNPNKIISEYGSIVNSKKAIHFVIGFIGWFVFQTIYCSFAVNLGYPLIWLASWPINILAIWVIYVKKFTWIACGAGVAFALNFIGLVSILIGVLNTEGVGVIFFLFPPFFLLFTHWYSWVVHL